jgi:carbon storage regulator
MLVVTRRVGEEIVIGDMIRVRIVAVENKRVKVGITAPSQMTVFREEVHQRLQEFRDCPGNAERNEDAVGSE